MFFQLRPKVVAVLGVTVLLSATSVKAQVQQTQVPQQKAPQQQQVQQPQQQGQQPQQQVQQQRQTQAGQRYSAVPQGAQQSAHSDAQLAAWLIVDNQNEVALAKMGQERAKSDDVKELSQKMRDDHQQFLSKLQPFTAMMGTHQPGAAAGTNAQANPQNEQRRGAEDGNTARTAQNANQNNAQNRQGENTAAHQQAQTAHGVNFVALKREMGAQCLQSAERELGQKSGREFDECYLGMQIGIHHMAVDTMTVFRNHASPALQQVLDQGIETAQSHLKQAKELMKEQHEKDSKSRNETSQRGTNLK